MSRVLVAVHTLGCSYMMALMLLAEADRHVTPGIAASRVCTDAFNSAIGRVKLLKILIV